MPENKSKIITEEGDINKPQKENIILTNEATQKDDDYLNNPLEKEENKSKGENKNNTILFSLIHLKLLKSIICIF